MGVTSAGLGEGCDAVRVGGVIGRLALAIADTGRYEESTMKIAEQTARRNELRKRLRAAGLRATPARMAVYDELQAANGPVSHRQLAEALDERGYDPATIYRNLIDLSDAGLVTRNDLGDHVWRFELAGAENAHGPEHPHFVCEKCGSVRCLPEVTVALARALETPRWLFERPVKIQLRGVCETCAATQRVAEGE